MNDDLKNMPDEYWKEKLTPEQYHVTREKGTEYPGTGVYLDNYEAGTYKCVGCGQELFQSDTKYESGSAWPAFWDVVDKNKVTTHRDMTFGMVRDSVECSRCGGHLGHVFPDGPRDKGGMRYCVSSVALKFDPKNVNDI